MVMFYENTVECITKINVCCGDRVNDLELVSDQKLSWSSKIS